MKQNETQLFWNSCGKFLGETEHYLCKNGPFFERTCFQCNFASPLRFSAKQCISDVRIYVMENLV